ncbi:hypothetical protein [Ulvibacterium marinum]|nr:hypothetical protein [Ulvibacterium marinum]
MKKIVISLITVGMVSFGFAQNSNADLDFYKYRELDISGSNHKYLYEVQDVVTPRRVKYLENGVTNWNVLASKEFVGRKDETFKVTFKLKDGNIYALYGSNGSIVSAIERFSNFAMPKSVGNDIIKQYPDWNIVKNRYSILYHHGDGTKRRFKVLIQKGDRKKWLKIDSSGKIA